jgi:hypothetical protein
MMQYWGNSYLYPIALTGYTPTDPDAQIYLTSLGAADGATPVAGVKQAVDVYFQALKTNSLWALINQILLFCGPLTLAGDLVAAKGSNPTNFNFTAARHNQKLGLSGNGTSMYLSLNTSGGSISQTSHHLTVTCSGGMEVTGDKIAAGSYDNSTSASLLSLDVFSTGIGRAFRSGTYIGSQFPNIPTGLGSSGFLCGSRTANNAAFVDYNGTVVTNTTNLTPSFITGSPFLFASNFNGTSFGHTGMSCQIATRGAGLTSAQSALLKTINNSYIAAIASI